MAFGVGFIQNGQLVSLETAQGFRAGADLFHQRHFDAGRLQSAVGFGADASGDDDFGAQFGDGFRGLDARACWGCCRARWPVRFSCGPE